MVQWTKIQNDDPLETTDPKATLLTVKTTVGLWTVTNANVR